MVDQPVDKQKLVEQILHKPAKTMQDITRILVLKCQEPDAWYVVIFGKYQNFAFCDHQKVFCRDGLLFEKRNAQNLYDVEVLHKILSLIEMLRDATPGVVSAEWQNRRKKSP